MLFCKNDFLDGNPYDPEVNDYRFWGEENKPSDYPVKTGSIKVSYPGSG